MSKVYVTMGWDLKPTTTDIDGYVFPRKAEMMINSKYYPKGEVGEYPIDPQTGKKLPILPMGDVQRFRPTNRKFYKGYLRALKFLGVK